VSAGRLPVARRQRPIGADDRPTGLPSQLGEGRPPAYRRWRREHLGYGIALLGTAAVWAGLALLEEPFRASLRFPAYDLVVLLCALWWGFGPGLTALAIAAAAGFVLYPGAAGAPTAGELGVAVEASAFLVVGGLGAAIAANGRRRSEELAGVQLELALTNSELDVCENELERRRSDSEGAG
jgi:hypothetical protein